MILYKKDTKGKIRILHIYNIWSIFTKESGLLWGKIVTHRKICKWKNIWKANETSPEEQAEKEVKALIKKKLREWYFKSQEGAENVEVILPMLAHSYEKYKDKIDWENCYIQPKLDWMRCLAFIDWKGWVKLISRKWVEIETMSHIVKSLSTIKEEIILDWELYCHGESFQENMKLIKKYREWESERIYFNIYDIVKNTHFADRLEDLSNILNKYSELNWLSSIRNVPTLKIDNKGEFIFTHEINTSNWFEWTIIRHWIKWYKKNGRDSQLLKYKDFIDETYKVVDIIPAEVYTKQGIAVCELEDGRTFEATPKMSHKDKEKLLLNREDYIWKRWEVRFFEYTDDWFPRFPILVGFRLDK